MANKKANTQKEVAVKFTAPSFVFQGVKYSAKDLEKRAAKGDKEATVIIAELVAIKAGVVSVEEVEAAPATDAGEGEGGEDA